MRPFRWLLLSCIVACTAMCQKTWADEPAAAKNDAAAANANAAEEKKQKEKPKEDPKEKAPLRKPLVLKPKDISMPVPGRVPQAIVKPQAEKKRVAPVADKQRRAPLRSPRQGRLNAGAAFRIENRGRHAPLSPAMQYHLHRSGRADYVTQNTPTRRQQAASFYPGVSRLPTQKPFANIERPPTGFERYWPLLLEGHQDRETGRIIWSLP